MSSLLESQRGARTSEQDSSPISKLLGGTKHKPLLLDVAVIKPEDEAPESGVMEVPEGMQFTEDTTSVEEGSGRKMKRTARKCKWCDNFSRGSTNLYA